MSKLTGQAFVFDREVLKIGEESLRVVRYAKQPPNVLLVVSTAKFSDAPVLRSTDENRGTWPLIMKELVQIHGVVVYIINDTIALERDDAVLNSWEHIAERLLNILKNALEDIVHVKSRWEAPCFP